MKFRDLGAQYQALKPAIDAAIAGVLAHSDFILGGEVAELERRLADYVGVAHCVACASGTDALELVLRSWRVGPGDAVFVPDFTFFATAEAAACLGAVPVFVDVDPHTFNLDPASLEQAVCAVEREGRLRPRAVVPVDLFGLPADFDAIRPVARRHGLLLLEDGAQGFGGSLRGRRACGLGDAGATSFFPAKPLGCYGDGGAVFTNDDAQAELLRSLRAHGRGADKYDNVRVGYNSRLDTLQAAVLLAKLSAFSEELKQVNRAAAAYDRGLRGAVETPYIPAGFGSSRAQYTILLPGPRERDALRSALADAGIPSGVYYPKPLHSQRAFRALRPAGETPAASRLCGRVLSLPMHPYLTDEEIRRVCEVVRQACATFS